MCCANVRAATKVDYTLHASYLWRYTKSQGTIVVASETTSVTLQNILLLDIVAFYFLRKIKRPHRSSFTISESSELIN
jgi:hypothetical protein